jgi:hypothetical protein
MPCHRAIADCGGGLARFLRWLRWYCCSAVRAVGDIFSGCIDGPWLGDNRLVAFAVDCITNDVNSLEESIWARKGNGKIKPFILLKDTPPAVLGGTISSIGIGRPGLVNNTVAAFLEISSGNVAAGLVSKSLSAKTSAASVCAKSGDSAP